MRAGYLLPIVAALLTATGSVAAAQELDNNGRYMPAVEIAPAGDTATESPDAAKPKPHAAKPAAKSAERKAAVETPKPKPDSARLESAKPESVKPDATAATTAADDKPVKGTTKETSKEPIKEPAKKKEAKANSEPADSKTDPKTNPKIDSRIDLKSDPLAEIPFSQRAAVRAALLWAAGDDASRGGGDQIAAAIEAFRKRHNSSATGPLTAQEREALLAVAKSHDDAFGWRVVTDPATGIRLGLPSKMVPHATLAENGTRWSSRHGDIQVETFRYKTDEPLAALFARMKTEPASRKVEYSAIRSDNFIISGMQSLRKFSVRAYAHDGEVRGFIITFDQAMEGIVAPVMVAMASAFAPFPDRIAPIAALTRKVEYGTGIVVSAVGHIVTDRELTEGCRVVVVPGIGDAEPVARDADHGLALLRVYGRRDLKPAPLATAAPQASDLTLIGVPDPHIQDGNGKPAEMQARLSGANGSAVALELKDPVPVAGFSGAAALDAQGRVAGMMETRSIMLASTDAAVPPVRLVPADTIRGFLAAHHVKPPQGGDDTANARGAVVRVICVRQ